MHFILCKLLGNKQLILLLHLELSGARILNSSQTKTSNCIVIVFFCVRRALNNNRKQKKYE